MWRQKISVLLARGGAGKRRRQSSYRWATTWGALGTTAAAIASHTHEQEGDLRFYEGVSWIGMGPSTLLTTKCDDWTVAPAEADVDALGNLQVKRLKTLSNMDASMATKDTVDHLYDVNWKKPIGEGAYGTVYRGKDRLTGEVVAVKKIGKTYTKKHDFLGEMNALVHIRKAGGHPGICTLHEYFVEGDHYILILDYIEGGELFDHLVKRGAYSEFEASRLLREVASAVAFLHGLGIAHCDIKPENLMLSSKEQSDAVIKIVDFGNAQVTSSAISSSQGFVSPKPSQKMGLDGKTLAYCPPEVLDDAKREKLSKWHPNMDMWALGVILYIMLTGAHPFDLTASASDEEVAEAIIAGKKFPLRNSSVTSHLSESALDLIERLMTRDPEKRLDAYEMLEHPWVQGLTARRTKMAGSDRKLAMYRRHKSGIQAKVFKNLVNASDDTTDQGVPKRTSLIEQSFRMFDQGKGHITAEDLELTQPVSFFSPRDTRLSLSGFSDLLAENMKNKYFPKGSVIYKEGEKGHSMFFIHSGRIRVDTSAGSSSVRGPGDFFGEGALLHPKQVRSATVRCVTPVHAMEISREYFEKYLAKSDEGLYLELREKDKIRKRNRAKMILRLQETLQRKKYRYKQYLYKKGEDGDSLFIVEKGKLDVEADGHYVFSAHEGNFCGEHSLLTGRQRNTSAMCGDPNGCIVYKMLGHDFRQLMDVAPDVKEPLVELSIRRDFKKAVVLRLEGEFPYDNPQAAFDAVKIGQDDTGLGHEAVGSLMRELYPYSDEEIDDIIRTINLNGTGVISYEEFKKVFIADIKKSASI